MSQKYSPSIPPQEEEELLPFLNDEFVRVGQTLNDLADGYWGVSMEPPKKLKPGTVKYFAPGVVGPVSGIYHYDLDNQWRLAGTKPKDLPGDFILFTPLIQVSQAPLGNILHFFWSGKMPGNETPVDYSEVDDFLGQFAQRVNCRFIQCEGRRGWKPTLEKLGYTEDSVSFYREVTPDELPPI
ncbi:hypothetical protein FBPa29_0072 [Pseudomonas phage vB_PaeP_FBPa29]|nr:hypothetical protein FBPa29_0072 [Pseudomonas phage vB_PaeP_FBPa29]